MNRGTGMDPLMLCLDVGGTELKGAAVQGGRLLTEVMHFPSRSYEERDTLLEHLADVFRQLDKAVLEEHRISGIRLAFPGPFDYENGICLLQGLDKYDSLYGVNLRDALAARLDPLVPARESVRFINDAAAFALGEIHFGNAAGTARSLCVCIGTGCGSAFGLGSLLASEGTPGVPDGGYLYPVKFLEGCIDDYISKRGLMSLTYQLLGRPLEGKELAERAMSGDAAAARCFELFGIRLRDALSPFLQDYRPDCLCLGGQITRSISWFRQPVEELCQSLKIALYVTADTSVRAIQGLCTI